MSILTVDLPRRRRTARWALLLAAAALASLSGCAHDKEARQNHSRHREAELLSKLTSLITGPTACLLTNTPGFQSEFTLSFSDQAKPSDAPAGQLFVRGEKILLAPPAVDSNSARTGGFALIWDAAAGRGFVSSEALQGYAPIGGSIGFTNLRLEKIGGAPARLEGRRVEGISAVATGSGGRTDAFELWRDTDASQVPVQVRSLNTASGFTLTLKKIKPGAPPEDVFLPPDGFTKYSSEEALLAELASRQQDFIGGRLSRPTEEDDSSNPGGPPRGRGGTR